jgi:2-methylcitrate dehydratase PrpD
MATTVRPDRPPVSIARAMARRARAVELSDLSASAQARLKMCLLDFLSCAFEARDLPTSRQAVAIAAKLTLGSTIVGFDAFSSASDAAFANATLGHGLVREDMHAGSIAHHGVVIWPVLLALAQRTPVAGRRLLLAAAVGYEVGGRVGRALMTAELATLFRPTGILGPPAGAMAGSILLGLDEDASVSAFALGVNASCGLNQWPHEGASDMYFHPGFAARSAVTAIGLAEAGAHGSEHIIEGPAGLFAAFGRVKSPDAIALFPDGSEEILSVYNKPVPACNFAQTACQAALRVAEEIDSVATIDTVTVHLPSAAIEYPGCDFSGPYRRALQAKMSIQFGVAAALVRKSVAEEGYRRLDDPRVLRLASLTRLKRDKDFTAAFPATQGAEVEVVLSTGARISRRISDVVAATEGEIRARFRAAASTVIGAQRADVLEETIDGLERLDHAGRVAELCRPSGRKGQIARARPAPGSKSTVAGR